MIYGTSWLPHFEWVLVLNFKNCKKNNVIINLIERKIWWHFEIIFKDYYHQILSNRSYGSYLKEDVIKIFRYNLLVQKSITVIFGMFKSYYPFSINLLPVKPFVYRSSEKITENKYPQKWTSTESLITNVSHDHNYPEYCYLLLCLLS